MNILKTLFLTLFSVWLISLFALVHAYLPANRAEFKRIEKLVYLIIQAQMAGFSDEELNSIVLRDNYEEQEVKNIVEMLDFIRGKYPYKTNEIFKKIINNNKSVVDLYELIQELLKKDKEVFNLEEKYYTSADIFKRFRDNEKETTATLGKNIRSQINQQCIHFVC